MAEPWYVEAFRAGYLDVYAHRDEGAAASEVAFPLTALGLSAGDRILDAGCGAGRHSRAVASRGFRVVGLDLSADLLRGASATIAAGGAARPASRVDFVRGDLRALPFADGSFDGVLSFFTSFGYFDDEGNACQLRSFRRVLRSGRSLVLDFLHAPRVVATLIERSEKERSGFHIVEQRAVRAGRVEKDVTMIGPDGAVRQWRESVRLYDPADLQSLLASSGFEVVSQHGDLGGGALSADSLRCVTVARAR